MIRVKTRGIIFLISIGTLYSCSSIEKSSRHGFESGDYRYSLNHEPAEKAYLDITEERVTIYPRINETLSPAKMMLPIGIVDTTHIPIARFTKKSLDIDITTVLFKYRPASPALTAQLSADLNVALYAGWRHDIYRIAQNKNPLGVRRNRVINRGFDFGVLAGTGTTQINPSTTQNAITQEYNGMILQYGVAAFVETNFASFGLATGFDHLLSSDRDVWIYHQKLWIGFVVGIALN